MEDRDLLIQGVLYAYFQTIFSSIYAVSHNCSLALESNSSLPGRSRRGSSLAKIHIWVYVRAGMLSSTRHEDRNRWQRIYDHLFEGGVEKKASIGDGCSQRCLAKVDQDCFHGQGNLS